MLTTSSKCRDERSSTVDPRVSGDNSSFLYIYHLHVWVVLLSHSEVPVVS